MKQLVACSIILHDCHVRKGVKVHTLMTEEAIGRELVRWPTMCYFQTLNIRSQAQIPESTQEVACSLPIIFRQLNIIGNRVS